jgi:hypothetical protein
VGTAPALLAAGCASTGTTSSGAAGADGAGTTSSTSSASSASTTSSAAADQSSDGATPPNEAIVNTTMSGGAPPSTAPPAGSAVVYGCDRQPVSKPKTYTLTCGDGGVFLDQLVWASWDKAKATATGVQTQNSCVPSCAAGSPVSTHATATLSGLSGGHYTKLHIVTTKGTTDYTISTTGPLAAG